MRSNQMKSFPCKTRTGGFHRLAYRLRHCLRARPGGGSPGSPSANQSWVTTAAAGLTLTRGNSENFLATLSLDTKRKWERDELSSAFPAAMATAR